MKVCESCSKFNFWSPQNVKELSGAYIYKVIEIKLKALEYKFVQQVHIAWNVFSSLAFGSLAFGKKTEFSALF